MTFRYLCGLLHQTDNQQKKKKRTHCSDKEEVLFVPLSIVIVHVRQTDYGYHLYWQRVWKAKFTNMMTTIYSNVLSEGEHRPYWHENDHHLFNSPFGGEHRQNWQKNQNHLFNSPFGGEHPPNRHENDNHLFNSAFGMEHHSYWHENHHHLLM